MDQKVASFADTNNCSYHAGMADQLRPHEFDALSRSLAMAPLSGDSVARLLQSHRELSKDWGELEALLVRLLPAWAECRAVLNELSRRLG